MTEVPAITLPLPTLYDGDFVSTWRVLEEFARDGRARSTYDREHGIATEAWSPIAQGKVLGDPVIEHIARELGKTPAQVVLRWHSSDVDAISALDKGESGRTGPHPDVFDYIPGENR